jgi:two-component system NtrC family sensor kinase
MSQKKLICFFFSSSTLTFHPEIVYTFIMTDMVFTKNNIINENTHSRSIWSVFETTDMLSLFPSILDFLGIGLIFFDCNLEIQYSTASAGRLLTLKDRIDQSLDAITDSKVAWKTLLERPLADNQPARLATIRVAIDGNTRILNLSCVPIHTPDKRILGGAVVVEDVTEKISRENELSQAERLIAMGKVAGKVAHELNNPMDGILRYLNLAMRILEQGDIEKTKEYLRQSRTGLLRMVHILSELLEFSRSSSQAMEPAPLDTIAQDALSATATALAGIEVRIIRNYEGQALSMRNDSLFQVFCNLIKNACDAMCGKGRLTITIARTDTDWEISFLDTGPGIPPELRDSIFQPFFTTKPSGKGVGLGLAICKDLVEKHKGTITVQCPEEGGSRFTVRLPVSTGTTSNFK